MIQSRINNIGEIIATQGDSFDIDFNFVEDNWSNSNFQGYTGYCLISPFGNEDNDIVSIKLNTKSSYKYTLELTSSQTYSIPYGSHTMKIVLINGDKKVKIARGILTLLKDSNFGGD